MLIDILLCFTLKLASLICFLISGLCIPANNTLFIVGISEKLAAKEPQLTLEVRPEEFCHNSLTLISPYFLDCHSSV